MVINIERALVLWPPEMPTAGFRLQVLTKFMRMTLGDAIRKSRVSGWGNSAFYEGISLIFSAPDVWSN